jgi:hypothetical protein
MNENKRKDPFYLFRVSLGFEDDEKNKKEDKKDETENLDNIENDEKLNEKTDDLESDLEGDADNIDADKDISENEVDNSLNENDENLDAGDMDGLDADMNLDEGMGEGDMGEMGDDMGMGENPEEEPPSPVGSVNRKYTLYTEYIRILAVLKESIISLRGIVIENDKINNEIKECVAELESIRSNAEFIIDKFKEYKEADIMLHLEMLKKRTTIILEKMQKIKTK